MWKRLARSKLRLLIALLACVTIVVATSLVWSGHVWCRLGTARIGAVGEARLYRNLSLPWYMVEEDRACYVVDVAKREVYSGPSGAVETPILLLQKDVIPGVLVAPWYAKTEFDPRLVIRDGRVSFTETNGRRVSFRL